MTGYFLAAGTNRAPAASAPAHMAAWLEAHGYQILRSRSAAASSGTRVAPGARPSAGDSPPRPWARRRHRPCIPAEPGAPVETGERDATRWRIDLLRTGAAGVARCGRGGFIESTQNVMLDPTCCPDGVLGAGRGRRPLRAGEHRGARRAPAAAVCEPALVRGAGRALAAPPPPQKSRAERREPAHRPERSRPRHPASARHEPAVREGLGCGWQRARWADHEVMHLMIVGARVKTVRSHLSSKDLAALAVDGGRPGRPVPAAPGRTRRHRPGDRPHRQPHRPRLVACHAALAG
jgi:hypothetical protein